MESCFLTVYCLKEDFPADKLHGWKTVVRRTEQSKRGHDPVQEFAPSAGHLPDKAGCGCLGLLWLAVAVLG